MQRHDYIMSTIHNDKYMRDDYKILQNRVMNGDPIGDVAKAVVEFVEDYGNEIRGIWAWVLMTDATIVGNVMGALYGEDED